MAGRAQIYPVQLSTQVSPPYSVYLPDYVSPGGEKLRLVLLQRDLTVQGYRLRLEMRVQVNGTTIMQTSRSAVAPPIILQPGIPTVLGGSDLSWYVQPQNLEFGGGYSSSTYEQTRSLPEGPLTITFTAYDYTRGDVQVSASSPSFFYATRDNPPLLNYPACGMLVTPINPQFLNFSWLPQNTSSPNSALQTNYIFSLWLIQPEGYNYQDIVQSAKPLYSVTTQQPGLVYGPGQPALTPGQSYAWRIQAVDVTGRDIFRNNGYSQTCNFIYGGEGAQGAVDYPAIQLKAASAGPAQGKLWWASVSGLSASGYDGYRLYYRKSQGSYDWFSVDVTDSMYRIFDLEPSTSYDCRLQGHKSGSYGPYTDVTSFTTDAPKAIACTQATSMLNPYSGKPLAVATPGMKISYGPWDVQLTTVQPLGQAGQYKGTCSVTVPFMGGMTFNASFDNLTIDDSRNVTAGNIQLLSQGMQSWIDSSINNQMGGSLYGKVVGGTDTTNVTVGVSLANLDHLDVVDSSNGDIMSFSLPGNPPIVVPVNDGMQEVTIKDSDGSTYSLDNQGHLTQLSLADGSVHDFFADPQNVAGLNNLADDKGAVVFREADSKYAFDSWKPWYSQASTILTSQYEQLSGGYYVSQKAIGAGESDIVGVSIRLAAGLSGDSVVFATGKGVRLIWDHNDSTLNLLGGPAADAQEVFALYPKAGGGYYSLGKLLVSAYEHQDLTVVLVPVASGGAIPSVDPQAYEDSLNSIYNKVNISWKVVLDPAYTNTGWDANGDGLLTMSGSSVFSNALTGEPAALAKDYKSQRGVDNSKRYIFMVASSGSKTGDPGDLLGDMPRGSQYGYIFLGAQSNGQLPMTTLAHELGHGQFNLEHTFGGDIALGARGATTDWPNLMDYTGSNQVHLFKYQWNQIHQPGQVMGIFESDTAGQLGFAGKGRLSDSLLNGDGKTYTLITPAGSYIVLSKDIVAPIFQHGFSTAAEAQSNKEIVGSLYGFTYKNVDYSVSFAGNTFLGYVDPSQNKFVDTLTSRATMDRFVLAINCGDGFSIRLYKYSASSLKPYSPGVTVDVDQNFDGSLLSADNTTGQTFKVLNASNSKYFSQYMVSSDENSMTAGHNGAPEILLVNKIAQLRNMYAVYFNAFTQHWDDWNNLGPTVSAGVSPTTGIAVSAPNSFGHWDSVLLKNDQLRAKWQTGTGQDHVDYYRNFLGQLIGYILEGAVANANFVDTASVNVSADSVLAYLPKLSTEEWQNMPVDKRVLFIEKLSAGAMREPVEDLVLELIHYTRDDKIDALFNGLKTRNLLRPLFAGIDDKVMGLFGSNNFTNLATELNGLFKTNAVSKLQQGMAAIQPTHIFKWNPVVYGQGTQDRVQIDVSYLDDGRIRFSSQTMIWAGEDGYDPSFDAPYSDTLSPFDLADVFFVTAPTQSYLQGVQANQHMPVPAYFLAWMVTKQQSDELMKTAFTALDVVALVYGVKELTAAKDVVDVTLALAQIVPSGSRILLNNTPLQTYLVSRYGKRAQDLIDKYKAVCTIADMAVFCKPVIGAMKNYVVSYEGMASDLAKDPKVAAEDLATLKNQEEKIIEQLDEIGETVVTVEKASGALADYKNVSAMLDAAGGSKAAILININSWENSKGLLSLLDNNLAHYQGLSAQIIADPSLLNTFSKLQSSWWPRILARKLVVEKGLTGAFADMVDDMPVFNRNPNARLGQVDVTEDIAGPTGLGNYFDGEMEADVQDFWANGNTANLSPDIVSDLQNLRGQGYELMIKPKVSINGASPEPDLLFVKTRLRNGVVTLDFTDCIYIDNKYAVSVANGQASASSFSGAQKQIVNEVKDAGVANVVTTADFRFVDGSIPAVPKGTTMSIKQVRVYGINQDFNLIHGRIAP